MKTYTALTFRHMIAVRPFLVTSFCQQSTGCGLKAIISMLFSIVGDWEVVVQFYCSRVCSILMYCQINSHFVKIFFMYHTDSMKVLSFSGMFLIY